MRDDIRKLKVELSWAKHKYWEQSDRTNRLKDQLKEIKEQIQLVDYNWEEARNCQCCSNNSLNFDGLMKVLKKEQEQ